MKRQKAIPLFKNEQNDEKVEYAFATLLAISVVFLLSSCEKNRGDDPFEYENEDIPSSVDYAPDKVNGKSFSISGLGFAAKFSSNNSCSVTSTTGASTILSSSGSYEKTDENEGYIQISVTSKLKSVKDSQSTTTYYLTLHFTSNTGGNISDGYYISTSVGRKSLNGKTFSLK